MNITNLKPLKNLQELKPLQETKISISKNLLNELDIILYCTNLCYYSSQILRNEIQVKNRNEVLNMVTNEVIKLYNIISKKDTLDNCIYTKKDTKDFFKKVGLKPKHLK